MSQAYIARAIRTAGGRRNGKLSNWHAADLAAEVLKALAGDGSFDPSLVEDVIMGCVTQAGEQASNVARNAVLAAGLPESIPGVTLDRQCGSSQQALHFAAQAVMSGAMDCVIAAGVESMTRVPMGSSRRAQTVSGVAADASIGVRARYPGVVFSQFEGAEMMAEKYRLSKDALDTYSLLSHQRAARAANAGAFDREIAPIEVIGANGTPELHQVDEGIRFDASLEAIASVKLLREGGRVTAASASQICDGSAGLLIANEKGLKKLGLEPLARIDTMIVIAEDPVIMLEAPINATRRALAKAGKSIADIDLYEVNEAFAPVPLAWLAEMGADPDRLNVNGGAIALGHPLGASGAKLMATLIHALRARGLRYGLQTMCEAGGMANVTIVEAL